jgi:hypothetical protein
MSQSSNAKTADNSVIAAVIWCSTRGWPPPEQRAVFQPSGVAVFAITAAWLGGTKMIGADTLWLFLLGLPALAPGTWPGSSCSGNSMTRRSVEWCWCCC